MSVQKNQIEEMENKVEQVADQAAREVKKQMKKRGIRKSHVVLVLVLLLITLIAGFFYKKYTHTDSYKAKQVEKKSQELLSQVGKLMVLPEEKPAIFDIQDPEVLVKEQAFFKGAQKGDTLLVFSQSSKAVIYSKERNIIVNVGPVTFDQTKEKVQAPKAEPVMEKMEKKEN